MHEFDTLYTVSLVTANMLIAGVMYLLSSPLFTVALVALGVLILLGTALTEDAEPTSESATADPGRQV